jgi:hypothetical protein
VVDSIVSNRFSLSDFDLSVTGNFDTPTTLSGTYWVLMCDNTLILPPSHGGWLATWQYDAVSASQPGVASADGITDWDSRPWNRFWALIRSLGRAAWSPR